MVIPRVCRVDLCRMAKDNDIAQAVDAYGLGQDHARQYHQIVEVLHATAGSPDKGALALVAGGDADHLAALTDIVGTAFITTLQRTQNLNILPTWRPYHGAAEVRRRLCTDC